MAMALSDVALLLDGETRVVEVLCDDASLPAPFGDLRAGDRLSSLLASTQRQILTRAMADMGADPATCAFSLGFRHRHLDRSMACVLMASPGSERFVLAGRILERDGPTASPYRMVFETAAEPLLIVRCEDGEVIDGNLAATSLFARSGAGLEGASLPALVMSDRNAITTWLEALPDDGETTLTLPLGRHGFPLRLAGRRVSCGSSDHALVRLIRREARPADRPGERELRELIAIAPEAIVLTDAQGRIRWANAAFGAMCALPPAMQAAGQPLDRYLTLPGMGLTQLMPHVSANGRIQMLEATLVGHEGSEAEIEFSAVAMVGSFGFVMRPRPIGTTRITSSGGDQRKARIDPVARVGHSPLKELVREANEQLERNCIEAALRLTGNNRSAAARVLGLSRQALYLKLERLGIADD
jgi:transcriptional regulator PpsR